MNKKTTPKIDTIYDRSFVTLFLDSIFLLMEANDLFEEHKEFNETLSRASILFSILLLEAVANTCIEELQLEASIYNDIDRLPTISKFDFYLRTKFRNKKLDRGNKYVEAIQELKRIRDNFVHVKTNKVEWIRNDSENSTAIIDKTKAIKFRKNPNFWNYNDALVAMKNIHSFLKHYFLDKCNFSPSKVAALLFSEDELPNSKSSPIPCLDKSVKSFLDKRKIDISYIEIYWV